MGSSKRRSLGSAARALANSTLFLQTIREHAGGCLPDVFDLEEVNDPLHGLPVLDLLFPTETPVKGLGKDIGMHLHGPTHHDVSKGGHPRKQGQILKGPGDSLGRYYARLQTFRPFLPFKEDAALVLHIKPVDDVQQRGLPCAVGADNSKDLAGIDLHTDIV